MKKRLQKVQSKIRAHSVKFTNWLMAYLLPVLTASVSLLTLLLKPGSTITPNLAQAETETITQRKLRPGLEGQSTLEWVLIGGMLVVIIVALLSTVFKPQLEAIITSILNTIQQNTTAK